MTSISPSMDIPEARRNRRDIFLSSARRVQKWFGFPTESSKQLKWCFLLEKPNREDIYDVTFIYISRERNSCNDHTFDRLKMYTPDANLIDSRTWLYCTDTHNRSILLTNIITVISKYLSLLICVWACYLQSRYFWEQNRLMVIIYVFNINQENCHDIVIKLT